VIVTKKLMAGQDGFEQEKREGTEGMEEAKFQI
jgi:hypothetical protein